MSNLDPSTIEYSDEAFDAFWDEEARNPNRNRIRIGRQYQAQVGPILKSGESDGRRLEDLETLSWNPHNPLSSGQLDQYFSIAKAIGLFVQAVDTCHEGLEEEEEDTSEQEEKPFEILQIGPNTSEDANSIFSTSHAASKTEKQEKQSITTRQQRLQQQKEQQSSVDSEPSSSSPLKHTANTRIQTALKGLSAFITAHHSPQKEKRCKAGAVAAAASAENPPINLGSSEHYNLKTLSELLMGEWTASEAKIFARALQVCGKNFSAIKKDYLPWKSVRSIIEFYYLSVDKENEQQNKSKKSPNKHLDRQSKSPLDEGKRKRSTRDTGANSESSGNSTEAKPEAEETNSNSNSNGTTGGDNGASLAATDSQSDSAQLNHQQDLKLTDGGNCLVTGAWNGSAAAIAAAVAGDLSSSSSSSSAKAINGNINGNHTTQVHDQPSRRNSAPGQEVRPLKAKPIPQSDAHPNGADSAAQGANSKLGCLNLYLHGELVLKLNAQQQETGQKWVESMEIAGSKKKRQASLAANSNGLTGRVSSAGLKRTIDAKVTQLFKEDADDLSTCGGDVSGSDDDSMTSNESSSLVASSPSSSSTIHSAAKKARVKVENLSSNGNSISPPNSGRKSESGGSGSSSAKQRTVSPSLIDNEIELKKKILEANLSLFSNGLLFNNVAGGLFEPPKAHSNPNMPTPQYPPFHVASASPVKSTPKLVEAPNAAVVNGHANGFVPGPVDLTRKPNANGHSGELLSPPSAPLHSPSRSRNAHQSNSSSSSSSSSPVVPKAHEAHNSTLSPSRLASSFGLFSLPAPPPPNVPVSPSGHNSSKHLKKSSLIRTGGVQFAK